MEEKSGRVLVRMPSSMHEYLYRSALAEGISMNMFICGLLAVATDWRSTYRVERPPMEIHQDLEWDMWMDRAREGKAGVPP